MADKFKKIESSLNSFKLGALSEYDLSKQLLRITYDNLSKQKAYDVIVSDKALTREFLLNVCSSHIEKIANT